MNAVPRHAIFRPAVTATYPAKKNRNQTTKHGTCAEQDGSEEGCIGSVVSALPSQQGTPPRMQLPCKGSLVQEGKEEREQEEKWGMASASSYPLATIFPKRQVAGDVCRVGRFPTALVPAAPYNASVCARCGTVASVCCMR